LASEKNENKQRIQKEENKDKKVFCEHVEKQTNNSLKANQIKETERRRERETGRKKERQEERKREREIEKESEKE
jgi:hypothetical protein